MDPQQRALLAHAGGYLIINNNTLILLILFIYYILFNIFDIYTLFNLSNLKSFNNTLKITLLFPGMYIILSQTGLKI